MGNLLMQRLGIWPEALDSRFDDFVSHLLSLRAGNGLIPKKAFDPLDLAALLPGLMMIERHCDVPDFGRSRYRYRLAGTQHRKYNGVELTGCWFDEVQPPQMVREFEHIFAEVLDGNAMHYKTDHNTVDDTNHQVFERVLLPMSEDGEINNLLIGYYVWR